MTLAVLVKLNESTQELLDDLGKLEPRARAERMRVLAMLGLVAIRTGFGVRAPTNDQFVSPPPEAPVTTKDKLKARFRGSFG
jgi:hypothetical protein